MKRFLVGVTCLVAVVGVTLVWHVQSAVAATSNTEGFNVVTSPLPIKISTTPGKTITTELRIKNQGDQPEGIKVGLMKFGAKDNTGQPDLYDLTSKDTFASWVHFSPQQFVAQPNIWMSVTMTINIPPTAALGYYLAVTFSPAQIPGVTEGAALNGSAATLVLLNVETPGEKSSLNLASFTTTHSLYEYLPVNFKIDVHNGGNIYVAPEGNIFIQKGTKPLATIDFNDAGGSVLPGSTREFDLMWQDGFPLYEDRIVDGKTVPDSHDMPKQDLHWDFSQANKFRFGHYTAKLLMVYDNGTQDVPTESTVSFWVLPWKLMLVGFVILGLVLFGIFIALRSFVGRTRSSVSTIRGSRQNKHGSSRR